MQLYSSPMSPFAARCRIQIRHKQLPVDIVAPPGGMGSADIRTKNPTAKIPVLDLGDRALAESWSIMEYLEATQPEPSMRPADAFEAAQLGALVRFTDLYLGPAMFPLFQALRGGLDDAAIQTALSNLTAQLQLFEQHLAHKPTALDLDLADAALLPIIWYAQVLARHFGDNDCLADLPITQAWWNRCYAVPAVETTRNEIEATLRSVLPPMFEPP